MNIRRVTVTKDNNYYVCEPTKNGWKCGKCLFGLINPLQEINKYAKKIYIQGVVDALGELIATLIINSKTESVEDKVLSIKDIAQLSDKLMTKFKKNKNGTK